jgi:hypothetical protein
MSNVSQFNISASSNNASPPNGAPEGMAPSTVNNVIREVMAAIARWYAQSDGSLVSGGTANAQTLTTPDSHAALTDIPAIVFRAGATNTTACTLAVDGLTAKAIRVRNAALTGGEIVSGTIYIVSYNATNDCFDLVSTPSNIVAPLIPSGTKMLFMQNTAPSGWTFAAENNDRVIINTSTVGNGGSTAGSWTISGLTADSHTHGMTHDHTGSGTTGLPSANTIGVQAGSTSVPNTSHLHNFSFTTDGASSSNTGTASATGVSSNGAWRPAYVFSITCTKN